MKKTFYFILLALFLSSISSLNANDFNKYVDLFIGTAGDNGQVSPAACVPYGMVQVCPDMDPRSHSGYDYDVNKISGFTLNRLSGIGCSGAGGNIRLKPTTKDNNLEIIKSTEIPVPGFYSATLNNGVCANLTATKNVALEQFVYPKDTDAILTLDLAAGFEKIRECHFEIVSPNHIQGFIRTGNTCNHGEYKLYFDLTTSHDFEIATQDKSSCELKFPNGATVETRIAISALGETFAANENKAIERESFAKIQNTAYNIWNKLLSKIEIKGATKDQQTLFYTSIYRNFLSPSDVTSLDHTYLGTDGQIHEASDFTYYSSWSMWDSYRTKFPLILLLDRTTSTDIAKSLNKLFIYGKQDWATDHESVPTVRTEHSMSVILDFYNKGIDIDLSEAYEGYLKELGTLQTKRPDQAYETSIDLWSVAKIADILDNQKDAKLYADSAKSLFTNTWNTSFKNIEPSFTNMRNSGLYQGTRWQYRWALPQYLDIMGSSVGGNKTLIDQLDYYYDNNLSNQTNEPGLHNPYIYNRLGEPDKAQQVVRKILTDKMFHLYGGNAEYTKPVFDYTFKVDTKGFLPEMDEDDGTMSAYYVFGAIGLYPLIVGEPWYEITSPLFDEIAINMGDNKKLMIKTKGRKSKNDIIKEVTFNNKPVEDYRIDHNELAKGGTLLLKY